METFVLLIRQLLTFSFVHRRNIQKNSVNYAFCRLSIENIYVFKADWFASLKSFFLLWIIHFIFMWENSHMRAIVLLNSFWNELIEVKSCDGKPSFSKLHMKAFPRKLTRIKVNLLWNAKSISANGENNSVKCIVCTRLDRGPSGVLINFCRFRCLSFNRTNHSIMKYVL